MPSPKPTTIAEAVGGLLARTGLQACRPTGLRVTLNKECSLIRVGPWKNNYARLTIADVIAEDWWVEPIPAGAQESDQAA